MKRFYKKVSVAPVEGGFEVHLDGKPIRTPSRAIMMIPNKELTEAIAAEWDAQKEFVETGVMPLTRLAYAAIDHVGQNRADVVDQISKYAETDLVSYRAEGPRPLQEMQNNAWQPLVEWMEKRFGVKLAITEGVIPVEQDPEHMAVIRDLVEGIDDFRLAAVQAVTTASGSVAIGLALWDDAIEPDKAWRVAQVEEDYQIGFWGDDLNAMAMREGRRQTLMAGAEILRVLNK